MAGAYHGWTSVGLPLGFLVWVVGVGIALASRFRPETTFATQGFQIEQNIVRNLLLTIGSWWVGAFVLHLANGLILAVAPRGDQLVMGPKSGIGTLLGTGLLAGLLWVATAAIVTILLITTLLAYVLCLTFMVFLPVFSALMLFDIGGVLGTIGKFGQTGWDIFIRAAFFPLPAALVLGAGAYIASGTMGFVQSAVAVSGFSAVAGTLAFAAVTFVTQLAALVATLWMLLGSRAARTAGGIMAGVGGAAMYSRAKAGAKSLSNRASMAGVGSPSGAVSSTTDTTMGTGTGSPSGLIDGTPTTRPNATVNSATAPSGVLDTERRDGSSGAVAPIGTPTGGRPATPDTSTSSTPGTGTDTTTASDTDEPIIVNQRSDLPAEQRYQPGYLSGGEFQPIESRGQERSLIVRGHDRFAAAYDSDGDHPGVYYRGEGDGALYDAAPVAGENWESSTSEQTEISRDAVFDARDGRGDSR
ncbi:hypothetical protein V5735_13135 (plasmid) [Haladaptatus sp. SPP-AMP-3]|uniref:hypothetical protein n=1 Tax=Haladaptatus sp. SPP-AMP-3 TaxID=3121295 RepID=UPI003C2C130A